MVYYNPQGFFGLILKAAPDLDLYIRWSPVCDGTDPECIGTKAEFLEAGCPRKRLDRADQGGSSAYSGVGGWDDDGFVVHHRTPEIGPDEEVFFWLPRGKLAEYAQHLHARNFDGAMAVLEKRRVDTEEIVE